MPSSTPTRSVDAPADYSVLRWLVAAAFIVILNETIMFNATPSLMEEFQVSERTAQWLSTAFMLTMAVVIPTTGWFLQRVTTRQAFAMAMTVFSIGTLIAALAPWFGVLLLGRVVQAAGTAVMMPLLMTTLMSVVAEQDRGRVMGNVTLAMSVAPALGPAVSGVILEYFSWRWMFGLVLPLAIGVAVAGLRKLTNVGEPAASTLDVPSVLLSALGFGGLVYGLSQIGAKHPTVEPWLLVPVGLALIAGFVLRQLALQRSGTPLLDLRTLTQRTYTIALLLLAVAFMAMMGAMFLLPLYFQDLRGLSTLETGMLMMPGGLAMGLLGPRVGRVFDRVGGRPLVIPGAAGIAVSLGVLTRIDMGTPVWALLSVHVLLMISLAAVFTPVFTLGLGSVAPQLYSHASSLLGALQQVAGAIGTAVVVTVMTSRTSSLAEGGADEVSATIGGMHWGFGVGAVLSLAMLVLALLLPGRLAQPAGGPDAHGVPDEAPVGELDPA